MIAQLIGAAPRYFGKSDPWTLIQKIFGIFKISAGKIFPYAITTKRSAWISFNALIKEISRKSAGSKRGILFLRANSLIGEDATFIPRPFGLSGCVTHAATENEERANRSRLTNAKSSLPKKIMFIIF